MAFIEKSATKNQIDSNTSHIVIAILILLRPEGWYRPKARQAFFIPLGSTLYKNKSEGA